MSGAYREIRRDAPDSGTAVLLLHGILSAPQFFDFLLNAVPDGTAVSAPLLAGHGGTAGALSRAAMAQWKKQVRKTFLDLSRNRRRTVIIAHSMGTLFAMEAAREFPQSIRRMVLLDVPLYAKMTLPGAFSFLKTAFGAPQDASRALAAAQAYSIAPDANLLHYAGWIPRYLELFAEMRAVRGMISEIRVPAVIFQSEKDELVAARSARLLRGNPAFQVRLMRNASHFDYPLREQERIRRAVRQAILSDS